MIYKHLPPVGHGWSHLPDLAYVSTGAKSPRYGMPVRKVWVHRWGVRYLDHRNEAMAYHGVVRYFKDPRNQASSHFVYPGMAEPNHCTQMVGKREKSWTEAWYNRTGISIESADAIWLGADPEGFAQLARIVAFLCLDSHLPPTWTHVRPFDPRRGFCRHADGGGLAGGHTACPTTDLQLWGQFVGRVQAEYHRGDFRKTWGREWM